MISLTRIRTNPPIHQNFFGQKRIDKNLKLLQQKRDGVLDGGGESKWDSGFWKESKKQLLVETNEKCAYCETPTAVVAYGDVEHFRPKSKYWWLAYSYENYLASCTICNQRYKKDLFDLEDEALRLVGPQIAANATDAALKTLAKKLTVDPVNDTSGKAFQDFKDEHAGEKSLIIDPYLDDPKKFIAYDPILANKEVLVVPTQPMFAPVIESCENLFGINRKELLDLRFQMYCLYMTLRYTVADAGISANTRLMNENRLKQLRSPKSAYSGMVLYFDTKQLDDLPWDFNIQI